MSGWSAYRARKSALRDTMDIVATVRSDETAIRQNVNTVQSVTAISCATTVSGAVLADAVALGQGHLPDAVCPACGCRLWLRRSVRPGDPGPWRCAECQSLPDVWANATAIPAPAGGEKAI
jgi:hypothetical protein